MNLLNSIKSFFSVGIIRIRSSRNNSGIYYVNSLENLTNYIIPHFEKYPLLTKKKADFELFKQIVFMMNNKEHLTSEGLIKIVSLLTSLNKGLSKTLFTHFPDIIPVVRPLVEVTENFNPH